MKRVLSVTVAVLLIVAMALGMSGCELGAPTDAQRPSACAHEGASKTVLKDASCTEKGSLHVECDVCKLNGEEDIPALGHQYSNPFAGCTACGLENPAAEAAAKKFFESAQAAGYSIRFTDLTVEVSYMVSGEKTTANVDLGEFDLIIDGDKVKFYADIRISQVEDGEKSAENSVIYGDGTYMYIKGMEDGEQKFDRVAYTEMLGDMEMPLPDMDTTVSGGSVEEMLDQLLGEMFDEETLAAWEQLLEAARKDSYVTAAQMLGACFVTADGKTFTLNTGVVKELNEALYTLTLSGVFDKYNGEGSFAKLKQSVIALGDKTIAAALKDLFEIAAEYGISEKLLMTTVNALVQYAAPDMEGFDLAAILASPEFQTMKLSDMLAGELEGMDFAMMVGMYFEEFGKMKVYDMLFDGTENAAMRAAVYELINTLADPEKLAVYFTLAADGSLDSFGIAFDRFMAVDDEGAIASVNGSIVVRLNGKLPADADKLVEEYDNYIKNNLAA